MTTAVIRLNVINPYAPTLPTLAFAALPSFRQRRTYFDAALIGFGMSFLAPICNTTYCTLVLKMMPSDTLRSLLVMMLPTAFGCVIAALALSVLVPAQASRWLSRYQVAIPFGANALLFSFYFSLLGFGYMQGSASIAGYRITTYVLAPALIAGFGALVHIAVRPWRDSTPAYGG